MRSARFLGLFVSLLLAGCGGLASVVHEPGSGTPPPKPEAGKKVFLVVEENESFETVNGNPAMPYLDSLEQQFGVATQYYADVHPSIGNYFMLTTGQIETVDDGFTGTISDDNAAREINAAGKKWKSYAESLPSQGYTGGDRFPYLKRHNPFSFFSDVQSDPSQAANLVPFPQFGADLSSGGLPDYSFIAPNAIDDGHSCPGGGSDCAQSERLANIDHWLSSNIAPLINSSVFQQHGLLIIIFDESDDTDVRNGGGRVECVVVDPAGKHPIQSGTLHDHASTLRTMLEEIGVTKFPGSSSSANDLSDVF